MATLGTTARNNGIAAISGTTDQGSGAGKIRIRASTTTLCDITLGDPAFGSPSTGVVTASGLPRSGSCVAAGTADNFQILDSDNNVIRDSTSVGTSGTELVLDSLALTIGLVITVTACTWTQPAS